jgi:hypothetical protein
MELSRRKIKKVIEKPIEEVNIIKYNIGDVLKYNITVNGKDVINYGHLKHIVNKDLLKVYNIVTKEIEKINYSDVIKKIDEIIYNDNISDIYNLLFIFLMLQIAFCCIFYLYNYEKKLLIMISDLIIKYYNESVKIIFENSKFVLEFIKIKLFEI